MWNDGWHNGSGAGWLVMVFMMISFWAIAIWLVFNFQRHNSSSTHHAPPPPPPPQSTRQSPEDILHERLARGDIDADEYRQRHDALQARRAP